MHATRPAPPPLAAVLSSSAVLCLAALFPPDPAASQSLGITAGLAGSEYRELASPLTLGVHAGIPLVGWLRARGDYRRYSDRQEWVRSTCQGLVPQDAACPDDTFRGDFTLHAVGIGLVLAAPIARGLGLEVGVQRSMTWADGVWRGRESGGALGRAPDEREAGWSVLASASYALARRLAVTVGGRIDSPEIADCIVDGYSGFCDRHDLAALEVGVVLRR